MATYGIQPYGQATTYPNNQRTPNQFDNYEQSVQALQNVNPGQSGLSSAFPSFNGGTANQNSFQQSRGLDAWSFPSAQQGGYGFGDALAAPGYTPPASTIENPNYSWDWWSNTTGQQEDRAQGYLQYNYFPMRDREDAQNLAYDQLGEGARQFNQNLGLEQWRSQFDMNLAGRQQDFSEAQSLANLGLAYDTLSNDRYGIDTRANAERDVAGLYSGAQRYQSELGLQGTQYQADIQQQIADMQNQTALQQQQLDYQVQMGQLSAQEYANETARLQQQSDYNLGLMNNYLARDQIQNDFYLGKGQLGVAQQQANTGQYSAETERMASLANQSILQEQNRIAQYEAETGRIDTEGRQRLEQQQIELDRMLGLGALGVSQQQANTGQYGAESERMFQQGQLGLGQSQLALDRQLGLGELGLGQQSVDVDRYIAQSNAQIQQEANMIDRLAAEGKISNDQRQIMLQELTQRQNNSLQWAAQNLSQTTQLGQLGISQEELALARQQQGFQQGFQNRQLAQELQSLREQLASQERQTTMQAYGRWQAPQTSYVRNWN